MSQSRPKEISIDRSTTDDDDKNDDLSDTSSCDMLVTLSKMKRGVKRRRMDDEEDQVRSKNLKNVTSGKERKGTVLSWMIEKGFVPLNEKVNSMNKEGEIKEDGILCSCCKQVLTVSEFGKHAGTKLHQEYEDILVEQSGTSLLQCLRDAWKNLSKSDRQDFYTVETQVNDPGDDRCGFCGDSDALIRCPGCCSAFHGRCLGMEGIHPGDWHCSTCCCKICGLPFVSYSEESGVLVPPISCDQCQENYHQECAQDDDDDDDGSFSISNGSPAMFCGKSCRKNFLGLKKHLGIKKDMDDGLSWGLIRRLPGNYSTLSTREECNTKIAVAVEFMEERLAPIIAHRRGISQIHDLVYNCGSKSGQLKFRGFYTFILEKGDEIICAASVRIHGAQFAEMPLFAILEKYRCQGMRLRLLKKIESVLCSLGVEKIIRPATSKPKDSWTTVFGFKPLEKEDEVNPMNIIVFPGRGLLQKPLVQALNEDYYLDPTSEWEITKLVSHDDKLELYTYVFYASFDQASAEANGCDACAPLAVFIAHWLLTNEHKLPNKSEFDDLIRAGSKEWWRLKEMPKYRNKVPHGHFLIKEIVNEKIRPLSIDESDSCYGTFNPTYVITDVVGSFDEIWRKISKACSELKPNGSPLVYIFGWNIHFFVLKVEHDACHIIDTLGSRLKEGCNQGYILKFDKNTSIDGLVTKAKTVNEYCKEYIRNFLAARWTGKLEADMNNGVALDENQILQFFHFEINRMVISRSSKPRTTRSRPGRRIVSGMKRASLVQDLNEDPMDDWERWKADGRDLDIVLSLGQKTSTSGWERLKLDSHDRDLELHTDVLYATFDQTSDDANGDRACGPLAVVIAHWLLRNERKMPTKSEFDELIRDGSDLWRILKDMPEYRERFPDGNFHIDAIVNKEFRVLSVAKLYNGAFHPIEAGDNFQLASVLNIPSFDSIWGKISRAWSELSPNGSPLVYIVNWNAHFFVLVLEHDASYIVDTLGSRLEEKCEQGYILKFDETTSIDRVLSGGKAGSLQALHLLCKGKESCMEYIKSFLAARLIRKLEDEMNNGVAVDDMRIQLCFLFEINRMEISRSSSGEHPEDSDPSSRINSDTEEPSSPELSDSSNTEI